MPRFIIERNFAEQLELSRDDIVAHQQIDADLGLQWLFSFLSADKKKSYCLYEAPNAEALREAARRLNIPADVIIEVGSELRPEQFA
jgi:peroxiredoxin